MKSDFKVLIIAATVVVGLVIAVFMVGHYAGFDDEVGAFESPLDSLTDYSPVAEEPSLVPTAQLKPFDPNRASEAELRELGLSDFVVSNIVRYRSRGGVFRSPESFAQVYGLTLGEYNLLKPYITLSDDDRPAADFVMPPERDRSSRHDTVVYVHKLVPGQFVDLNRADTTELQAVPGIGAYYAKKIIELRNQYGGFVSLEQLNDIKAFPTESFAYLTIPDGGLTRLNINTADFRSLQRHPYIGYNRARQITDYRRLKGHITSLDELSLLPGFSAEERQRLLPYVEF